MSTDQEHMLWGFARGDISVERFEPWLYVQTGLEAQLGGELADALMFADYRSGDDTWAVRQRLREALQTRERCECPGLRDLAALPMTAEGLDVKVFSTLDILRNHGADLWWLHLSKCRVCEQNWLVAQEERIYDEYFLKRLDHAEAQLIIELNSWPDTFISYERVLRVGRSLGEPCVFLDACSPSLVWTAKDLRKERSSITNQEIAYLIGIPPEAVARLAKA